MLVKDYLLDEQFKGCLKIIYVPYKYFKEVNFITKLKLKTVVKTDYFNCKRIFYKIVIKEDYTTIKELIEQNKLLKGLMNKVNIFELTADYFKNIERMELHIMCY